MAESFFLQVTGVTNPTPTISISENMQVEVDEFEMVETQLSDALKSVKLNEEPPPNHKRKRGEEKQPQFEMDEDVENVSFIQRRPLAPLSLLQMVRNKLLKTSAITNATPQDQLVAAALPGDANFQPNELAAIASIDVNQNRQQFPSNIQ